jgi:hypothetical protein
MAWTFRVRILLISGVIGYEIARAGASGFCRRGMIAATPHPSRVPGRSGEDPAAKMDNLRRILCKKAKAARICNAFPRQIRNAAAN